MEHAKVHNTSVLAFAQNWEYHFRDPNDKDCSLLGSILGSFYIGNYHSSLDKPCVQIFADHAECRRLINDPIPLTGIVIGIVILRPFQGGGSLIRRLHHEVVVMSVELIHPILFRV